METVTLNNGVEMPIMGYGTYQTPARITERCVADALKTGYRLIDTAQCYGNEHEVGLACKKSGIPRSEIFITTKLWACRGYRDTLHSIDGSLKQIGMDYIDLLLIHEPTGNVHEIYRGMETALQEGKVRAIGISNFLDERYQDLVTHCAVVPAVSQLETHVFRQQAKMRQMEARYGTRHQAWSPLACGENGIFSNPVLAKIARSHGKSTAQVALRFLTQQGIMVIPKSTRMERMKENLESLNFDLIEEEMEEIRGLEIGRSLFGWW